MNLATTQCPFCFANARDFGSRQTFTGPCPSCGKDTTNVMRSIRTGDTRNLRTETDRAAVARLKRIFNGGEAA